MSDIGIAQTNPWYAGT